MEVLTPEQMLSNMIVIVAQAFDGKVDKSGLPYILHCLKVMHYLDEPEDLELQAAAVGHDLIEDIKGLTYAGLREQGYSERVIECIRCVTRVPGETEQEYEFKVMSNWDSIRVKKADLRHNSDIRRLKGLREKDIQRTINYHKFYTKLKDLTGPVVVCNN